MEAYKIRNALKHFRGTTEYNKHLYPGHSPIYLTDGCMFLREECNAYWLFDQILKAQSIPKVKAASFQKWFFAQVKGDLSWKLTCTNTDDNRVIWSRKLDFFDFPLQRIEIWLIDKVALLPSEY